MAAGLNFKFLVQSVLVCTEKGTTVSVSSQPLNMVEAL